VVASTDPDGGGLVRRPRAHRIWNDKARTLAKYGIPISRIREFEVTSRVTPADCHCCLAGTITRPKQQMPIVHRGFL